MLEHIAEAEDISFDITDLLKPDIGALASGILSSIKSSSAAAATLQNGEKQMHICLVGWKKLKANSEAV